MGTWEEQAKPILLNGWGFPNDSQSDKLWSHMAKITKAFFTELEPEGILQ